MSAVGKYPFTRTHRRGQTTEMHTPVSSNMVGRAVPSVKSRFQSWHGLFTPGSRSAPTRGGRLVFLTKQKQAAPLTIQT